MSDKKKVLHLLPDQYCWLITALVLFVPSIIFQEMGKSRWALFFLTFSGCAMYFFAATLCPFLNLWDEQYHALVAKNCMEHPFTPMLYSDTNIPGHSYDFWTSSNIWLHKQPLFLWQIALSFKIFGVSELSLRLPSIIMCTLFIPIGYRMAKLLTNQVIAYFTAISIAFSWYLLLLTSGLETVDHNDICFIFNISGSLWTFTEYIHDKRKHWQWALVIGLFAGCAILTKWLVGLLVFLTWGFYLLFEYRFHLKDWKVGHYLLALGITLLVVLPWQIYILHKFSEPAHQELFYNFTHLNQAVEGHQGPPLYYLMILPWQYFGRGFQPFQNHFQWNIYSISCYIVLVSGFIMLLRTIKKRSESLTILATTLFVYLFFSIAKTKMPAFSMVVCIIWFMSIATFAEKVCLLVAKGIPYLVIQKSLIAVIILGYSYYQTNYNHYLDYYMGNFSNRVYNKQLFKQLDTFLPTNCYVFHTMTTHNNYKDFTLGVFGTFYSNRQCYSELPSIKVLKQLQGKGYSIAIFDTQDLSEEYRKDNSIILIRDTLKAP